MSNSTERDFQIGDRVRIKPGVTDVMSSDMALGGWTGVIRQIDEEMAQVSWDDETMTSMPSTHRDHWLADGLPVDCAWLPKQELEFHEP